MPARDVPHPDVPADWAGAVRRILEGGLRRILVLGAKDAGKSSFCRVLLREAGLAGRQVALLDADPAQKLVGPPACVTLGHGPTLVPAAFAFVGTLDPLRGWRRLVSGTARLVAEAVPDGLLLVNTSGLLAGAGRRLKAAKIAAVGPQLLLALGEDPGLEAILADHPAIPAVRLGRSPLARRKGEGKRRALREAAFRAYFRAAPAWALDLPGLWLDGEGGDEALPLPGQLVALTDAVGRDRVLGVVLRGAPDGGALVLRAPRPEQRVAGLRWGVLRLPGDPAAEQPFDAAMRLQPAPSGDAERASGRHIGRRPDTNSERPGMSDHERRPDPQALAVDHDQPAPGDQARMRLQPDSDLSNYRAAGKLTGKAALITGADSGIGRAVAIAFAKEGADIAFAFNHSEGDAAETRRLVEREGRRCLPIMADVTVEADRARLVRETVGAFGRLDVLVNNAAYFEGDGTLEEIEPAGLRLVFETNIIATMLMAKAALPHLLQTQGCIINTSSTTSILGKKRSLAYSSTKGAVNVFTKSLALELAERGVRVNAVLPGPFWTPAIATSSEETVKNFGSFTMLGRAGQPEEIAPAYVFLAADGSYVTGALLEVSGGFKSVD